jgi:adenine-specific DNA methylase
VKQKKLPGGRVAEKRVEETVGGILHWGRESGPDLEWFRQKLREAYGGRAPKVLDPFAGGGAIPLEAMRLGCEVTAIDINPVAWFILKCTREYPHQSRNRNLRGSSAVRGGRGIGRCRSNKRRGTCVVAGRG